MLLNRTGEEQQDRPQDIKGKKLELEAPKGQEIMNTIEHSCLRMQGITAELTKSAY